MSNSSIRLAVPRTLLYYRYFPLWESFFNELGVSVETSKPSSADILSRGSKYAHTDSCLPIKLAFGHVDSLFDADNDFLFLPRFFRLENKSYVCPKVIGFTDMVKCCVYPQRSGGAGNKAPYLIDNLFDTHNYSNEKVFRDIGRNFTSNYLKINRAYSGGVKYLKFLSDKRSRIFRGEILGRFRMKIGVIGHPYNIHDDYINMGVLKELNRLDALGVTYEDMPSDGFKCDLSGFPSGLFWSFGREIYRTAMYFMSGADFKPDGLIYLAPFGCGLDSILVYIIQNEARARNIPFLNLTLDEHSAKAAILTRLEAFIDMLACRRGE
jgi:predicted nucleotide-binding protein (sugar kinase/HSP70/actin superfamily)